MNRPHVLRSVAPWLCPRPNNQESMDGQTKKRCSGLIYGRWILLDTNSKEIDYTIQNYIDNVHLALCLLHDFAPSSPSSSRIVS